MEFSDIFVITGGIFVLFIILRFIGKLVARIFTFVAVLGFLVFVLFFWRGGMLNLGNTDFMLVELEQKYCEEIEYDAVKCNCIVEPLLDDIKSQYSNNEIVKLQSNKLKSLKIIMKSLNDNKEFIITCLSENNSLEKWDEFIYELQDLDIKNELEDKWEEIKNKTSL